MRTTIRIRPNALELAKQAARETGRTLGEVVSDALVAAYGERSQRRAARIALPTSGRGGLLPGVNLDKSSDLCDL